MKCFNDTIRKTYRTIFRTRFQTYLPKMNANKINSHTMNRRSMNVKFAKDGSYQLQNFNNVLRDLLAVNNQSTSPTYQDSLRRIQSMVNVSKTINNNLSLVFDEFIKSNIHAAMKWMSVMYLKLHEMIIDSKNVHIKYYIVEEKQILNIKKIALQLEKHCRKSLDILFGLMARVDKKIIPNYNFIEMKHHQIKPQYSLRPRKNISYGEEDTFDDEKDTDYVFEEEANYTFLNKNVDKNGEIVLKPGIDNNDDDDDFVDCDYHDVIHANGYEPKEELIYNYKNNKLVNVYKRRIENGNAIYTQIKM